MSFALNIERMDVCGSKKTSLTLSVYLIDHMDEETIRAYDAMSDLYDAETKDFWEQFPKYIFSDFKSMLRDSRVVDLGSGPGRDAEYLRNLGMDVTCIDGAESMIHVTERKGFRSILKDIRSEDLNLAEFDGVWAYSSFIHISDSEAKKVLNRVSDNMHSGTILFLGLIEGMGSEIVNFSGSDFVRMFQYYNEKSLGDIMENTGFKLIKIENFKPRNHNYLNCFFRLVK